MGNKVKISFTHECDKCGAELNVNTIEVSNIITVEPCLNCANKMADQHTREVRERVEMFINGLEQFFIKTKHKMEDL